MSTVGRSHVGLLRPASLHGDTWGSPLCKQLSLLPAFSPIPRAGGSQGAGEAAVCSKLQKQGFLPLQGSLGSALIPVGAVPAAADPYSGPDAAPGSQCRSQRRGHSPQAVVVMSPAPNMTSSDKERITTDSSYLGQQLEQPGREQKCREST